MVSVTGPARAPWVVLLTLVVVVSIGSPSIGVTGMSTAAVSADEYDLRADSGETFWQAQRLFFDGDAVVPNVGSASQSDRTFQLRRTSGGDRIGGLIREFTVDTDGEAVIPTRSLSGGEYLVVYKGSPVYIQEGSGYTASPPDGTTVNPRNSAFDVVRQSLAAEWSPKNILKDEEATLETESNRGSYTVEVSARGLDFDDLESIFAPSDYAANHAAEEDDDTILLKGGADRNYKADFRGIRTGTYRFILDVRDSEAEVSATITVSQARPVRRFGASSFTGSAGDFAEFTLNLRNTDTAFVVIGGPIVNFLDVLRVTDSNNDGRVTVRMNTRYAGLDSGNPGVPAQLTIYQSERDRVTVYRGSDTLATGQSLDNLRRDLGIDADGLTRPIEAGDYPLAVAGSDDVRAMKGQKLNVVDEQVVATLSLGRPALQNARTFVAPPGNAGSVTLEDLGGLTTERSTVALGDRIVLAFELSGIFGHLDAEHDGKISGLVGNDAEGINLEVIQTNPSANRQPIEIDLAGSGKKLLVDAARNRLVVVLDTRSLSTSRPVETGQRYAARLTLSGIDRSQSRYNLKSSSSAAYTGYPYIGPGASRDVATTFDLAEPRASFDRVSGGTLEVPNERGVVMTGTTNVAPGTELLVRHLATGSNPFLNVAPVTVGSDGTWRATFDFEGAMDGQLFSATIRRGGDTIGTAEGRIQSAAPPTAVPTPQPPLEPTTTPPPPTQTPQVVTETVVLTQVRTAVRTVVRTPQDTPVRTVVRTRVVTRAPGGQPGFGIPVALALLAAVTLALRRR